MATKTVTPAGNAQIDTAQSKFGGASGLFDGTGDYLSVTDDADFSFGTGDFTIDFWVRFNSVASFQYFYSQSTAADNFFNIVWTTNNRLSIQYIDSGVWQVDYYIPFTPSTNTWYHIELSKDGTAAGDWHTFIDGVEGTKTVVTGTFGTTIEDFSAPVLLGQGTSGGNLNGWLDEYRVSKGIARHTSNFTPSTSAYTTDADTKLLLHMDGADASTTFTDDSVAASVLGSSNDASLLMF